jgi:hypothetical protein
MCRLQQFIYPSNKVRIVLLALPEGFSDFNNSATEAIEGSHSFVVAKASTAFPILPDMASIP